MKKMNAPKLIRITTIPLSLKILLKGQHRFMTENGFEVIGISSEGEELDQVGKDEGIRVIPVNMHRRISIFNDLKSLWKLYKTFLREKPVIVHSITPKAGLLSMVAGKIAGVPIRIHTFTGLVFPTSKGFKQRLLITTDKILCWAATQIYPEGEGVKKDLINYHVTKKPLKVIANGNVNGINTDFFSQSNITVLQKLNLLTELNIAKNNFVFILVGRMVRDKGVNELVTAFSCIEKIHPNKFKLLLVGSCESDLDPLKKETLYKIKKNRDIISVGYQNDIRPFLAISDCFILPSYREGFPNVVMQAGAMGLPSIVTDISGCNEIIIDGENGLIIKPKDSDELANAMLSIYQNHELRLKLTANARPMITSRYEQNVVWNALLDEYNSLLKAHNKIK